VGLFGEVSGSCYTQKEIARRGDLF
jgi:hypothetical protein